MTMTLGFSVRPLNAAPTKKIIKAMQALSRIGACPLMRLVVPGTFDGPKGSSRNRWTPEEEAGLSERGYFAYRILQVTSGGETLWLPPDQAAPIFADMKEAGTFVSIPNSIAADYFYMLAPLSLPWPLRGEWLSQFPDRRYRLGLPSTLLDDTQFGTHQYHMLLCKGALDAADGADAAIVDEIGRQGEAFFRCAQRHKLLTDFY